MHAVTKQGPFVVRGIDSIYFRQRVGTGQTVKGKQGSGDMGVGERPQSAFSRQDAAGGGCHDATTDNVFMDWLEKRATSSFKMVFTGMKIITACTVYFHQ